MSIIGAKAPLFAEPFMFASNFQPPENWDRSGLPGWTYASEELFALEQDVLFRRHWMLACHISDLPEAGHYIGFDIGTERALILRGKDRVIRAFHNLCRHRGSRVVEGSAGQCKQALTCPFHGWTYNLDGTLKSALQPRSFPPLDPVEWGLKPIEMDIWHGFVFIRFQPGPQPPMSRLLARFDNLVTPHGLADMIRVDGEFVFAEADVNWKSMRDVDNEGYHVPKAHPSLQDLYGKDYVDEPYVDGASLSIGKLNDKPRQFWSVREYRKLVSRLTHLPAPQNDSWIYIGIFPNSVIALYPDSA
ncbi:MAG TPA: ring-hydroxylating oxygenase subunit alpha, partial [Alphaproteobacteria bacterium]|nr:ring-hydroxylating oxygenase subunit alpha [Alphaproteobacteria bacterium]